MGNLVDNKFTWVIQNFNSLQSERMFSEKFFVGGCKWRIAAFPKDLFKTQANYMSLYLGIADSETLPCGWKRHAKCSVTVVNQLSENLSQVKEKQLWLDQKIPLMGWDKMLLLTELYDKDSGFLVNNEVKIVVEIDVLEVQEESQEVNQPLKRSKRNDDGHLHNRTSSIDVNGFQVLPSQAESVKRIFEKHPNMALNCRAKNQYLRTLCINALLNLIQTLCQSLQELSIDDLGQADDTLTYLKNSGFKVDWLERKLEEVKEKKIQEEIGETRMQELEEELKDIVALLEKNKEERKNLKKKCSDTKALLKKEKAKVLAARAPPLTLEDVV